MNLRLLTALLVLCPLGIGQPVLTHGQAVGDPLPDAASVWARVSASASVSVIYGTDPSLAAAAQTTPVAALAATDFTVRIDLTGLLPDTVWYYRLRVADPSNPASHTLGPVGRFRTPPDPQTPRDFTIAFAADIRDASLNGLVQDLALQDPDLVLFLGDIPYADSSPAATTLAAYRQKHAQVRAHPPFQALLAQAAMAPIWDDHEIANDWDAAMDPSRVTLGRQVWKEWFPVRPAGDAVYRSLRYGKGLELFIIDTRTYRGRNAAPDLPGRPFLGAAQLAWLQAALVASDATFKVIVSSVPLRYGTTNKDHWQGYMRARQELLGFIADQRIPNVFFLAGDQHWSAVHHHREGIPEFQACPLATGVRTPPAEPEPEVLAIDPVPSFGILRIRTTVSPHRADVEIHDATGVIDTRSVVAGAPGRIHVHLDHGEAGFVAEGPHRFQNQGADTRLPYAPPGTYSLAVRPPFGAVSPPPIPALVLPEGGFISAAVALGATDDPAHPSLFRADFDTPDLSAWTIVDEGTIDAPSAWFQDDFQLVQSSNIYGGSMAASELGKPGSYAAAGDFGWTDVTLTFRVKTHDDDALGAMVRLAPDGSCYRFSMDRQRGYRRLTRQLAGVTTLLAEVAGDYVVDRWYDITIKAIGPQLSVALDGQTILTATDAAIPGGRIALYSWGSQVVWFDRVWVRQGDVPIGPPGAFLADSFSAPGLAGWTVVDQGTVGAPSAWSSSGGSALQASNIHGGTLVGSDPHKPGTFLRRGNPAWTDVAINVRMMNADDDAIGVMFRVVDAINYYRFSMDSERSYRRITRTLNGVTTTLAESAEGYSPGRWYDVSVQAEGPRLQVFLDGTPVLVAQDATFGAGSMALYCWGSQGAQFDDIVVAPPSPPAVTFLAHGDATSFTFDLRAPGFAGRDHVLAMALASEPGIPLGVFNPADPRIIPLAYDPLLLFSLGQPPFFMGFTGTLDGFGNAQASVTVPPGVLFPGLTLYASGLILDGSAPTGVAAILPPVTLPF